jgi:glutamyl-tRNA reductase
MTSTITQHLHVLNARVTYRNAPIHLLEKFTFKDLDYAYKTLLGKDALKECVIIQTCNRVEVFATGKNSDEHKLIDGWASLVGLHNKDFEGTVEISKDKDVVLHLMKLASGLDSLVIGEDQVLGQIKRAFEFSRRNRYAGFQLSLIFDKAIKVGSKVRTSTSVNKGSLSVGSMAVNMAEEHFNNLKDKCIMLIGSGEGASLIAKSLKQRDINFIITSRTFERAKSFAATVAGMPISFEDALEMFNKVDLIFVSTTAPYYLVTYDRIQSAMNSRKEGMMIFDLSNPRTVEDKILTINKVNLINLDQITEIVEKNIRSRKNEIEPAEKIIDNEMKSVDIVLKRKRADPIVVSVFKSVDTIRDRELQKALSILGKKISSEEARIIEQLSHALVEGILSAPMNNLRKELEMDDQHKEDMMKIVARLFKYEE